MGFHLQTEQIMSHLEEFCT